MCDRTSDTIDLESIGSNEESFHKISKDKIHVCTNPLQISAIELDVPAGFLWPESADGFTLTLWLCLEGGSEDDIARRKKIQKTKLSNLSDSSNNNGEIHIRNFCVTLI